MLHKTRNLSFKNVLSSNKSGSVGTPCTRKWATEVSRGGMPASYPYAVLIEIRSGRFFVVVVVF